MSGVTGVIAGNGIVLVLIEVPTKRGMISQLTLLVVLPRFRCMRHCLHGVIVTLISSAVRHYPLSQATSRANNPMP